MFGASTIEVIDGEWCIVENEMVNLALADADVGAVFMPRDGKWCEVNVGRVRQWDGEVTSDGFPERQGRPVHYQGLVAAALHHDYAYCSAAHLNEGDWVAYERQSHACWAIEPHATVKIVDSDCIAPSSLQPAGRFVCLVDRQPPESFSDQPLGLVALDLAHLPFDPAEYEVRDGAYFSTNRLTLDIQLTETEALWGKLTAGQIYNALFWSD